MTFLIETHSLEEEVNHELIGFQVILILVIGVILSLTGV